MVATFAPNFQIKVTDRKITANPGAAFLIQAAQQLGTSATLQQELRPSGPHQRFHPEVHALTIAALLTQGGSAISDAEALRRDPALLKLLGIKALPATNTLLDWLHSGETRKTAVFSAELTRLAVQEVCRRRLDEIILDPDATLFERGKSTSQRTYKGFRGYAPMVVSEARTGMIWYTEFRAGNESPGGGAMRVLKASLDVVPKGVRVNLRADSAWYQAKVLDFCHDSGVQFAIGADQDSAVKSAIAGIPETAWRRLPADAQGREVATTVHTLNDSKHAYTLVVTRVIREQTDVFEGGYFHRAIITNRRESAEETVQFYDGRGADERLNDELKNGFSAKDVPTSSHAANGVFWMLACLAFNLVQAAKAGLPASWAGLRIKALRFRWLCLAGLVAESGRRVALKIQEHWPWREAVAEFAAWASG